MRCAASGRKLKMADTARYADYPGRMRFAIRVLVALALPGLAFSSTLHLWDARSPECGTVWLQRAQTDPTTQCTPAPIEVAVIGFIAIAIACLAVALFVPPRTH
jgi:hypothetical protein